MSATERLSYIKGLILVRLSEMPFMQPGCGGAIVNIASTLANVAAIKAFAYFATDGGLLQMKRATNWNMPKTAQGLRYFHQDRTPYSFCEFQALAYS